MGLLPKYLGLPWPWLTPFNWCTELSNDTMGDMGDMGGRARKTAADSPLPLPFYL